MTSTTLITISKGLNKSEGDYENSLRHLKVVATKNYKTFHSALFEIWQPCRTYFRKFEKKFSDLEAFSIAVAKIEVNIVFKVDL